MTDVLKELVTYRMDQAEQAVRAARFLISGGFLRDSVNRSYYAMFYAVLALLATKELGTSKHSAAISLFDRDFVKDGLVSRDLSGWIHSALSAAKGTGSRALSRRALGGGRKEALFAGHRGAGLVPTDPLGDAPDYVTTPRRKE